MASILIPGDILDQPIELLCDHPSNHEYLDNSSTFIEEPANFSDDELEEEPPGRGAGTGNNFVSSFQRSDRIGVWARAVVSSIKFSVPAFSYILSRC
jgi:hypothetical protein